MVIKKFQGKSETEAIEAAKKEMGAGIVVMNVRTTKKKGLFHIFSKPIVEVTAALEEEAQRKPAPVPEQAAAKQPNSVMPQGPVVNKDVILEEPPKENSAEQLLGEKLESLQNFLEKQLQKPDNDKKDPEAEEDEEQKPDELTKFLTLLRQIMLDNEMEDEYATQIVEEIERGCKPGYPFDVALANAYQKMILKFGQPECITPAANGPKAVFFLGPTGVGKTTTIAKIASKFRVEEKKKVALLTADTYRIAAAEQLRTYANILEIPFKVIYSADEVGEALEQFKEYDYVLVDTAGHACQNVTQRDNMVQFIAAADGVEKEVYLVLSATTKYRDLLNIAEAYHEITEYKLIFTKLDETAALGNLFNVKLYTGAPLSYVTYGQNVPDDIEVFNPQKTVKQLLGGKS